MDYKVTEVNGDVVWYKLVGQNVVPKRVSLNSMICNETSLYRHQNGTEQGLHIKIVHCKFQGVI
jgi:hypothetical protein